MRTYIINGQSNDFDMKLGRCWWHLYVRITRRTRLFLANCSIIYLLCSFACSRWVLPWRGWIEVPALTPRCRSDGPTTPTGACPSCNRLKVSTTHITEIRLPKFSDIGVDIKSCLKNLHITSHYCAKYVPGDRLFSVSGSLYIILITLTI